MTGRYTVEAVVFGPDGVRIQYMGPADVRAEGEVFQAHTIAVSWASEALTDLITAVEEAAIELLSEAIKAWAKSVPVDLVQQRQDEMDDDETDEGLGYG